MIFEPVLVPIPRSGDPLVRARGRVFHDGVAELRFVDRGIGPGTIFIDDAVEGKRAKLNVFALLDTF